MSKTYTVTAKVQYPCWNEREGFTFPDIVAESKSDAIKKARKHSYTYGIIEASTHGLSWWKATEHA